MPLPPSPSAPTTIRLVDGRTVEGLKGDTVASALLANGIHLMGRSFKYHRPRGVVSAGSEEPNALLGTTRGGPERFEPNTRATIQEVYEGLTTESQNRWPSLAYDVGEVNDPGAGNGRFDRGPFVSPIGSPSSENCTVEISLG